MNAAPTHLDYAYLSQALYRESRGEITLFGDIAGNAVAWAFKNRSAKSGRSIYYELTQVKWAVSSFTDPKDKQLTTYGAESSSLFTRCVLLAAGVIDGRTISPIRDATLYFNPDAIPDVGNRFTLPDQRAINWPHDWDKVKCTFQCQIGHHYFFIEH